MSTHRFGIVALLVAGMALSAVASAQSASGVWKGKLHLDKATLPKPANAQQQQMMATQLAMLDKMVFSLTLKKDKTYTIVVSGQPQPSNKPADQGSWTQTGGKVNLKSTKKTPTKNPDPVLTLSKDGKTMVMSLPPNTPTKGSITFVRS